MLWSSVHMRPGWSNSAENCLLGQDNCLPMKCAMHSHEFNRILQLHSSWFNINYVSKGYVGGIKKPLQAHKDNAGYCSSSIPTFWGPRLTQWRSLTWPIGNLCRHHITSDKVRLCCVKCKYISIKMRFPVNNAHLMHSSVHERMWSQCIASVYTVLSEAQFMRMHISPYYAIFFSTLMKISCLDSIIMVNLIRC